MSAPTPVRALVHRRTLVTAGVHLLIISFLDFFLDLYFFIFFIGFFSMLFSSIMAFLEKDIKKIVALRTLSQIGLCFLNFSFGFFFLSFFHILSHAFFKRLLFLQVGFLI